MELIRGLHNLRDRHRGCAVTIGNFDGVHLGHRAVLGQLGEKAREKGVPSLAMLFEPQPQEYFTPDSAPPRLSRLGEKLYRLREGLVDRVLCLHFDERLAGLGAREFVQRILKDGLGATYVVVGDDFCFGRGREGDFSTLRALGAELGFEVARRETFLLDGERISSTRIRQALNDGDMAATARMLGHPYTIGGRVAHGHERGRTIGFPTLNIYMRRQTPVRGVYAVRVNGLAEGQLPGVANIGFRPTVEETRQVPLLEVHLFGFAREIYGEYVQVEFLKRIRDEMRFVSFEALKVQIQDDVERARAFLFDESTDSSSLTFP